VKTCSICKTEARWIKLKSEMFVSIDPDLTAVRQRRIKNAFEGTPLMIGPMALRTLIEAA
jgi:hypothetical protein